MTIAIVEPHVELITPVEHLLYAPKLIELAGRVSHKSEDRIEEGSAARFIKMIIGMGHLSVLRHAGATYRVVCSRTASHQWVRHVIGGVHTQESQRYIDYDSGLQIIVPLSVAANSDARHRFNVQVEEAYDEYLYQRSQNIPPEDARFLLPSCIKTELVTTFNFEAWRWIIQQRALNSHAQWEIKKLTRDILYELNSYLPDIFGDLVEKLKETR